MRVWAHFYGCNYHPCSQNVLSDFEDHSKARQASRRSAFYLWSCSRVFTRKHAMGIFLFDWSIEIHRYIRDIFFVHYLWYDTIDVSSRSVCFAVMSKNDAICLIEDFKNVEIIEFCEKSIHVKFKNEKIYSFVFHSMGDVVNARRSIMSVIDLSNSEGDNSNSILREIVLKIGPKKKKDRIYFRIDGNSQGIILGWG